MKLALVLFLASLPIAAQVPEAPKPQVDRVLLGEVAADAAVRALDAYSTLRFEDCTCKNRELILPNAIAKNAVPMAMFSAAMVGVNWYAAAKLERHHHQKLARLLLLIDTASTARTVASNLELKDLHRYRLAVAR